MLTLSQLFVFVAFVTFIAFIFIRDWLVMRSVGTFERHSNWQNAVSATIHDDSIQHVLRVLTIMRIENRMNCHASFDYCILNVVHMIREHFAWPIDNNRPYENIKKTAACGVHSWTKQNRWDFKYINTDIPAVGTWASAYGFYRCHI